jgi:hypothetical protein
VADVLAQNEQHVGCPLVSLDISTVQGARIELGTVSLLGAFVSDIQ